MQTKSLTTLFTLCKRYHVPPYSSKCNLFSTNSHFDLIHILRDQDHSKTNRPCNEFGDDVEKIYKILNNFATRSSKLELALKQSGVVVRKGLTERVFDRCGNDGNLGYRFFSWASKQPGYMHHCRVYRAMVKSLARMSHIDAVWGLVQEMGKDNSRLLSFHVFGVLMKNFGAARMVKKAIRVLDAMPKCGCEQDEYFFGCLLDFLCKRGSVKEAAVLFEDMRFHFRPTMKHFTSLLYGWCKEGKIVEAKYVLIKMRAEGFEPDVVVYNILLDGYAVARKIVDAFDILVEMKNKGFDPNVASFTTIIQSLCAQEKMEEAMKVFLDLNRNGCEADVTTYNILISGFANFGKIDKAYSILDQMIEKGLCPSIATYLCIVLAHEKNYELQECLELKEKMGNIGLIPDMSIYNSIISLACKFGEVEEGIRIWNEIEANGESPQRDTFILMIDGFIEKGHLVEACDYFKEMVMRGLLSFRQYGTLKSLLKALLLDDKLEMGKDVWKCMMTKGCKVHLCAWTIWIHELFSNNHDKEACSYFIDMMDAGLMPQPDTFAKLMWVLKERNCKEIAAEITDKVKRRCKQRQTTFKIYKPSGVTFLSKKPRVKLKAMRGRAN